MSGWLLDGLVIAGYFGVVLWIGLRGGQRDRSLQEFALGGRSIPWWAVLGSIIAAETSAGTFLGTPGEGYALRNYTYLQLVLGTIIARFIIGALFLKPFYALNVYSIYEFLQVRFGPKTKNAASLIFLVTRVLASGTRLYISAVILVLGYRLWTGLAPTPGVELSLYFGSIVFLTVVTAIYTALGGIQAVIWTDLIQATALLGSGLLAVGILWSRVPVGIHELGAYLGGGEALSFLRTGTEGASSFIEGLRAVLTSDYTIWAALIGSTFTTLATHGTDQDMVQRMLTAPDVMKSRRSLYLSGLMDIPIVFLFLSIGILLRAYYQAHPDPALPVKTNEIFGHFILTELPAGVRGLLVAGIFATTMGSLSAALNALATSFVRDWYVPVFRPSASDSEALRAARNSTVGFAFLMVLVASATAWFVIMEPKSRIIPIALGIFGYTYGSLLGVFLLGTLTRLRGSDSGNRWAMMAGFLTVAVLAGLPGDLAKVLGVTLWDRPAWLPVISFPWRIFFGTLVTFSVGLNYQPRT